MNLNHSYHKRKSFKVHQTFFSRTCDQIISRVKHLGLHRSALSPLKFNNGRGCGCQEAMVDLSGCCSTLLLGTFFPKLAGFISEVSIHYHKLKRDYRRRNEGGGTGEKHFEVQRRRYSIAHLLFSLYGFSPVGETPVRSMSSLPFFSQKSRRSAPACETRTRSMLTSRLSCSWIFLKVAKLDMMEYLFGIGNKPDKRISD